METYTIITEKKEILGKCGNFKDGKKIALEWLNNHIGKVSVCNSITRAIDTFYSPEITKDNIHLYYEFMSNEDLERYSDILSDKIIARINILAGKLNFNIGAIGGKELELFNSFLDEKRNKNQSKYIGVSIFGVKDTLKPIDEYIEDIKESSKYKEYIFKSKIKLMEQYPDIYNLSINDIAMINCTSSDYHRNLHDLLQSLQCLELDTNNKYELWKTNSISILDPNYYYESINFKTKDIETLIKAIETFGKI